MSDAAEAQAQAQGPPLYASHTTSTTTSSPPPEPVPIEQLNAQAQAQAQAHVKQTGPSILEPDMHGIAHLRSRPGCFMLCWMCPFPYFCMGCCMSRSSNLDLNESKQHIIVESWPGYLRCCGTGKITISYAEIANFVAVPAAFSFNRQSAYRGALVTRQGTIYKLTDPQLLTELAPRIIEWQRFVFGRHPSSQWTPPDYSALIYTPAPSS